MLRRALAAVVAVTWALPVLADEEPVRPEGERLLYVQEFRQVEELSDEQGKAFALLGRVTVEASSLFSVRARRMVVWLDPDADAQVFSIVKGLKAKDRGIPLWAVRAIYAEGGRTPAVFQTPGRIFRCSAFYYDFVHHRGIWLDANLRFRRAPNREEMPDLVLRAKRFAATGPGEWTADDVTFFSSNYHEHEVVVQVERIVLEDRRMREALGRLSRISAKDYRGGRGPTEAEIEAVLKQVEASGMGRAGKRLTLYDVTGRAYGVPFARWRKATVDGDNILPLRVEVDAGSHGSLGTGARLGVGLATRPVGFMFGAGYYDGRGPLFDLEIDVRAPDGRFWGRSFGVYLHDHGDDRGLIPSTRDRYWTKNQYRFEISETWRVDFEVADLSDARFLRTYDEREFKEGKEQETLLYVRRRGERTYLTLTGKTRTIGFLDQLEELPRFTAELPALDLVRLGETGRGEPITVQLAASLEVANLFFRASDTSPRGGFRTARADFDPTVYVSLNLGPVRVVPFGTFRFTGYETALDGEGAGRFAGSAGVRADLRLSRWYGDLLHVMNLSVEYVDQYTVTESASALFTLDATDRVTPFEALDARWRHRLLKRAADGLREIVSLEFHGAWFPNGKRPLGGRGDGFVEMDLEWRPRRTVLISARSQVDTELGSLETGSLEGWWRARRDVVLSAGIRHLDGDSDILTTAAEFEVDTRWRIVLFSQVDFKNDDSLDQGVLIQRLGKTAVVGVRFKYDPGDEDFGVSVKVDLLEKFRRKQRKRLESARRDILWR